MKYMVGENWLELFDVVVVNARKPKFFNETTRYRHYIKSVLYLIKKSLFKVKRATKANQDQK